MQYATGSVGSFSERSAGGQMNADAYPEAYNTLLSIPALLSFPLPLIIPLDNSQYKK